MFFIIAVLGIGADLFTKKLVETTMGLGDTITVIPGLLDLHFLRNYGAAYSILQNKVDFLLVFTGIMLIGLAVYYFKTKNTTAFLERLCICLIFSGGTGNFISRLTQGYVVDFFDIHIIPVFNVADICITCGCILLILYYFIIDRDKWTEKPEEKDNDEQ